MCQIDITSTPLQKWNHKIQSGKQLWSLSISICDNNHVENLINTYLLDFIPNSGNCIQFFVIVNELGRSEEKDKVELGGEQLYVTLEPVENEGKNDSYRY